MCRHFVKLNNPMMFLTSCCIYLTGKIPGNRPMICSCGCSFIPKIVFGCSFLLKTEFECSFLLKAVFGCSFLPMTAFDVAFFPWSASSVANIVGLLCLARVSCQKELRNQNIVQSLYSLSVKFHTNVKHRHFEHVQI